MMTALLLVLVAGCTTGPGPTPTAPPAAAGTAVPRRPDARPVVIDTDMAADDWLAILYLLQRPDITVQAITVTGTGEAHCAPGVTHARGLLALVGYPAIPVSCGRETPLRGDHVFPAPWREGSDRLQGLRLPPGAGPAETRPAPALLAALVEAAPRPMTLLTLGPLTNVAAALQTAPALGAKLAGITIMGGAVTVPGNIAASAVPSANKHAEWNIYIDPYAAGIVFQAGAPLTLIPLDATNHVPVNPAFYDRLKAQHTTPAATFAYDLLTKNPDFVNSGEYHFWDSLAAATLTDPTLVTFQEMRLRVIEAEGPESGRTRPADDGAPVQVAVAADAPGFERVFLATLNGQTP
jgi:pyrimidine-specific ribonucleoside hydrolase